MWNCLPDYDWLRLNRCCRCERWNVSHGLWQEDLGEIERECACVCVRERERERERVRVRQGERETEGVSSHYSSVIASHLRLSLRIADHTAGDQRQHPIPRGGRRDGGDGSGSGCVGCNTGSTHFDLKGEGGREGDGVDKKCGQLHDRCAINSSQSRNIDNLNLNPQYMLLKYHLFLH